MKLYKIILPFCLFSLLFFSCDFFKDMLEEVDITFSNKTDKEIVLIADAKIIESKFPFSVASESSRAVSFSKHAEVQFKFTYGEETYRSGFYADEDFVYLFSLDSEGKLKVKLGNGKEYSPSKIN